MPFTALKLINGDFLTMPRELVVRRLMPFTALKHLQHNNKETNKPPVVRRLMPFTALKPLVIPHILPEVEGCAPPNAVYGIET